MTIDIIYENKNFLAVNKPAGVLVHHAKISGKGDVEKEPALTDWLLARYPEVGNVGDDPKTRPGIVHRLDKDTSGVLLVAKDQHYFEYLKGLFQENRIKKIYHALVLGVPKEEYGVIEKDISLKAGTTKRTIFSGKLTKNAITEYRVKGKYRTARGSFSLLEVMPKTGRTHQIRVHLASIGHPIMGDALYGGKNAKVWAEYLGLKRQFLHAFSLQFESAPGEIMHLEAELPEELSRAVLNLQKLSTEESA